MKYNVLMILADQHHAGLLGCAGDPQVKTPNLDRFAASGVRFAEAYCQNPICTPSRVSILSGQYCQNHGYYGLSGPSEPRLSNLFRHFKQGGYRTAGIGKLHLPDSPRNWIADDVDLFADSYEMETGGEGDSEYLRALQRDGLRELEDSWHNPYEYGEALIPLDAMPSKMPFERTQEMWCADKVIEFIGSGDERPFFIQANFQKPHHPLLPVKAFWDQYPEDLDLPESYGENLHHRAPHFRHTAENARSYSWDFAEPGEDELAGPRRAWRGTLACVTQLDAVFGRLMDFLENAGLAENTIVIYGSDHGSYHTRHGLLEKAPGICSQDVCRVPMLWRVPGLTPESGTVCGELVENIDMASTLPELCGLEAMESADGCSLRGLLAGAQEPIREVAVTENPWSKSIRWDRWRMVHYVDGTFPEKGLGELYDLVADPGERENLYAAESHRGVRDAGIRKLCDWLIRSRRVRTSHPAVWTVDETNRAVCYPTCEDGFAPSRYQPRNRKGDIKYL